MFGIANRLAPVVPAALALAVVATTLSPAVSRAAQCGEGTRYDAPSNTCVVAAQAAPQALPPPQAPPPPPPPPPPPHVWVSICAPIRFISICTGT
ncbi:hypothetical protein [Mycobacterium sp. Aquia_213]|uniref:hypothetical protein n=1 Tax=Mycobacterium sp. Aquia_213 TaxID=2991728 RepID=UPI00226D855C|nr:hypothetical protein [Mycobacterium sp. Aquia_213]WAC93714.1 hypothetical protein LMQ14_11640 [Mycobacterium sp. Aquia_213]